MYYTPTTYPCDKRKQRDLATSMSKAFNNVDFSDSIRLEETLMAFARLNGEERISVVREEHAVLCIHAGNILMAWTPRTMSAR